MTTQEETKDLDMKLLGAILSEMTVDRADESLTNYYAYFTRVIQLILLKGSGKFDDEARKRASFMRSISDRVEWPEDYAPYVGVLSENGVSCFEYLAWRVSELSVNHQDPDVRSAVDRCVRDKKNGSLDRLVRGLCDGDSKETPHEPDYLANYPVVPPYFMTSFHDNQLRNVYWFLPKGGDCEVKVNPTPEFPQPATVKITKVKGDSILTDFDYMVLSAMRSVCQKNKARSRLSADGAVPFAAYSDIVLQLSGKKDLAKNTKSGLYKAVRESLRKMKETAWEYDLDELYEARRKYRPDLFQESEVTFATGAPTFSGYEAKVRLPNGVASLGIILNDCWVFSLLDKFENRFNVKIFQEFFPPDIKRDRDFHLYAYILKRGTASLPTINQVFLYQKDRPNQETLFKALGMEDISEKVRPDGKLRKFDFDMRMRIEAILNHLKKSPVWHIEMPKDGKLKKMTQFTIRYSKDEAAKLADQKKIEDKSKGKPRTSGIR